MTSAAVPLVIHPVVSDNAASRAEPTAGLAIRPAVRSDRTAIQFFCDAILRNDYFVRRGQLKEMLAGRFHQVWVAEIDRVLVGIAVTTRGTRLVNALVHPAYRGLGVGRALVEASGAVEVRAKIDMRSGDPRGFYEAMGFRGTGERNGKGNIEVMRRSAKLCFAGKAELCTTTGREDACEQMEQ